MKKRWNELIQKFCGLKDLGYLGSSNIIGIGISAIFWFYLASILEVKDFGEIQYYLAIAGIAYVISSIATSNTITVFSAKNVKIISTLFLISIVGGILSFLVIYGMLQRLDIGLLIFGFIINDVVLHNLLGKKDYSKYSKNFLYQKILMLIFGIGFHYIFGLEGIIFGLALSYIHLIIISYKIFRESKIEFSLIKSRKNFITNNYFETVLGGLRGEIDKIIIAPMLGFVILGNYALAMQAYVMLMVFPNIILKYIVPQDASGIPNPKLKIYSIFVSVGISIFGMMVLPTIIPLFLPKYEGATVIIQILSVAVIPATIGFMYISKFLSLEKSSFILVGRIIGLSTIIIGMMILPKFFGMSGAAAAFVISSIAQTTFFILAYEKIKTKN